MWAWEGSKGVVEARGVGPGKTGWKRHWVLGHMGGGGWCDRSTRDGNIMWGYGGIREIGYIWMWSLGGGGGGVMHVYI